MTSHATIKTGSDSWVDQGHVQMSHGNAQYLKLNDDTNDKYGLIHFALPFRKGATITVATLQLHAKGGGWDDSTTLLAKRITTKWREDRVNWHNRPTVTATNQGSEAAITVADGALIEVDVTSIIQDVADGAVRWQGFQLSINDPGDHLLHSAESTAKGKRPQLYLEWTYLPDEPTDLSPAEDGVVNLADVYFSWSRMTSTDKHATQASVRLELDTVNTFNSGNYYDSGYYTTVHAGVQGSALTAWANLTDNTNYFWRIRVRDDAGATSGVSDIASFRRDAWTASLAITSPPGATAEGTTPVFTWTFAPQTAFKAILEMKAGTDNPDTDTDESWDELEHDHDNWTTAATQGFDLEPGVFKRKGALGNLKKYRLTVYVRDDQNRVGTPGDPPWLSDQTVAFTISPTGNPAAVTKVVLAPDIDSPMVWVRWHRAAAPDSFVIFKDDDPVVDGIDPIVAAVNAWDTARSYQVGDHVVDGGIYYECIAVTDSTDGAPAGEPTLWSVDADDLNYEYRYWGQVPGDTNTYEVVANTDGEHSDSNDTTTRTLRADGLWLVATSNNNLVAFAELGGRTNRKLEIGETADVYNVVNRRAPVRVSGGIRGYEGTMSGKLGPIFGKTANEWRDNLQKMVGRQNGEEVRIIMQGLNVPVTLGRVSITPTPIANLYEASIEVFQVGEFFDLGRGSA